MWYQTAPSGSTHHNGILSDYLDFSNIDWENFTRYVKTRWLSLEKCVSKEKFDGLKSMFLSRVEGEVIANGKSSFNENGINMSTKFGRLKKVYKDVFKKG